MAEHTITLPVGIAGNQRSSAKIHPLPIENISEFPSSRSQIHSKFKTYLKYLLIPLAIVGASISFTLAICVFFYLNLGPKLPTLYLNSLVVLNFTINGSQLTAHWNLNLTFKNPDHLWEIYFDYVDCTLIYDNGFNLAWNDSLPGFTLKTMREYTMNVRMMTDHQLVLNDETTKKILGDWMEGLVNSKLSVKVRSRFEGEWWLWWMEGGTVVYNCLDLKLGFRDNDSGEGTWIDGGPKQC